MKMNLGHLRIGHRLGGGFAAVLLLVALLMGIGIWNLQRIAASTRAMMELPLQKERLTDEWFRLVSVGATRNAAIAMVEDATVLARFTADSKKSTERNTELVKQILALVSSPAEKELVDRVSGVRNSYNDVKNKMIEAKTAGRDAELQASYAEFLKLSPIYLAAIAEVVDFQYPLLRAARGGWHRAVGGQ